MVNAKSKVLEDVKRLRIAEIISLLKNSKHVFARSAFYDEAIQPKWSQQSFTSRGFLNNNATLASGLPRPAKNAGLAKTSSFHWIAALCK